MNIFGLGIKKIGMNHFALATDSLHTTRLEGNMLRSFKDN